MVSDAVKAASYDTDYGWCIHRDDVAINMDSWKYHDHEVRKVPGPPPESSSLIDHPISKAP